VILEDGFPLINYFYFLIRNPSWFGYHHKL